MNDCARLFKADRYWGYRRNGKLFVKKISSNIKLSILEDTFMLIFQPILCEWAFDNFRVSCVPSLKSPAL